jgi:hypothetical protein
MTRTISLCAVAFAFVLAACHAEHRTKEPIAAAKKDDKKIVNPTGVQPPPIAIKSPTGQIAHNFKGVSLTIADKVKVNQLVAGGKFRQMIDGKVEEPQEAAKASKQDKSLALCNFIGAQAADFQSFDNHSQLQVVATVDQSSMTEAKTMITLKHAQSTVNLTCSRPSNAKQPLTWEEVEAAISSIFNIQST